jgi:lipoprotein-releasing system permease protein
LTGFQNEIRNRILGINPHIILSGSGEIEEPQKLFEQIKGIKGVSHVYPFTTFQAMAQSRERLSGIIVKGLNADDIAFLGEMVKEGSGNALKTKENVLIGKELAKQLGLFVGDRLTLMVPLRGYSPMEAKPETAFARVGGIFERVCMMSTTRSL